MDGNASRGAERRPVLYSHAAGTPDCTAFTFRVPVRRSINASPVKHRASRFRGISRAVPCFRKSKSEMAHPRSAGPAPKELGKHGTALVVRQASIDGCCTTAWQSVP
jgi:hypothetical protein